MFLRLYEENHAFFRNAAVYAAQQLALFDELHRTRLTLEEVAAALSLPSHRLSALVDVLCAEGVLLRSEKSELQPALLIPTTSPPPSGWGQLADAIGRDTPLSSDETLESYHRCLEHGAADTAASLAAYLREDREGGSLLDLGCGAGHYTAAFLERTPKNRATAVDVPEVMAITRSRLDHMAPRVSFVEGDARLLTIPDRHDVALLSHILHWHDADGCRKIVDVACQGVRSGGSVVVYEVEVAKDLSGPLSALYFNLNLSLYSARGRVHPVERIGEWMRSSSLRDIRAHRPAWEPGMIPLAGVKR